MTEKQDSDIYRRKDTLWSYIRECREKTFQEYPFRQADALLLSQLSYLKMEGVVPGFHSQEYPTLRQLGMSGQAWKMFSDPVYGKMYRDIFEQICDSRRYGQIHAAYFLQVDEETACDRQHGDFFECHFAAVTFQLGESSTFIAFRGTNEKIGSWKEDLSLACMDHIPSQTRALAYLKGVARRTSGRIIAAGHSKGGNLAVFAAAMAPGRIQERIARVYNFDGVGFREKFLLKTGYGEIRDRIYKLVPRCSMIGQLLTDDMRQYVVNSYKRGIMQHDLMNWKIRNGRFFYAENITDFSRLLGTKMNACINSLGRKEIQDYIDCLYRLAGGGEKSTVYEMKLKDILEKFREFSRNEKKETKRDFLRITRKLLRTGIFGGILCPQWGS